MSLTSRRKRPLDHTVAHLRDTRLIIWLYLHHGDIATGSTLTKQQLEQMLKDALGAFNKTNLDLDQYRDHVQEAVTRAAALDATPGERWPSTTGTHAYRVTQTILNLLDG